MFRILPRISPFLVDTVLVHSASFFTFLVHPALWGGGGARACVRVGVNVSVGMWAFVMTVNGKAMKGSNTSNDCALDLISDVL